MTTTLDLYTNNIKGGTMTVFRVVIEVDEPTLDDAQDHIPVSYTHMTLPKICSV